MSDVTSLGGSELSDAIHGKRLSCEAVMETVLERIAAVNPWINAIVSLRPAEDLLAEARTCDRELRDGHSRGWMHGMPIAIKDLSEAEGIRCTYGSPLFADFVPDFDDIQVERIKKAGAIVIGKTNTPEWGFGSHSYNPVFGVTRNPYDLSCSAGGSSGGAAAALSARLLPVADGSDMMGSLRNPAGFNNVVGFRPSFGRIPSLPGRDAYLNQLATLGPMGRSVRDVARLFETQAGFDPRDPASLSSAAVTLTDPDPKGKRIAWFGDFGGYLPFERGVLDVCGSALPVFEALGYHVDAVVPEFDMGKVWWAWTTLRSWLTAGSMKALYEDPAKRSLLKPEVLWEIESGLSVPAGDVYEASAIRTAWYQYLLTVFERYEALVMPSAQVFPFDAELTWPREVGGRSMDTYHRWMEVVIGPSMAGLPVVAMPAGFGGPGSSLPAGIQIVGRPRGDNEVLSLGLLYERNTDWLSRVPAL
ncbi:amidase [Ciceribacter sp. L1K22]|uniref:amidase n=1 Tax=Ciceribacter sp. L1K22 TaxID=2820275 RepID=UPI001ABDB118|nr:amidase [Ciceribacter sp. L1K22]MBO3762124.1 amidase [Ciceribacter sp. L1K22]